MVSAKGLYQTHLGHRRVSVDPGQYLRKKRACQHEEHNHEHQDHDGRWLGEMIVIVQILMLGGGESEEVLISRCHGCHSLVLYKSKIIANSVELYR